MADTNASPSFDPAQFERPAPQLFTYYILGGLITGPFILFLLPALWFRYSTLRYRFEEGGLRMQVGFLFRKETVAAYRRIQDIHLTSNVIQRWLGIANISIQTASGSALPEIVLEGITEPEAVRDWLYERLRGAKPASPSSSNLANLPTPTPSTTSNSAEISQLLTEIRDHLAVVADANRRREA